MKEVATMAKQKNPKNQNNQNNQNNMQNSQQQYNQQQMGNQAQPGLTSANNFFETAEELSATGQQEHGARKQKKNPEKGVWS